MLFKDRTETPRRRAEDLLARLSLSEKVGQVNQRLYGFASYVREGDHLELSDDFCREVQRYGGLGVLYGLYRADPWSQKDFETGLWGIYMAKAYNQAQKYVLEHSRFGIPMLLSTECPHGHQALDGYLLPVNLGVGAAWNPALTRRAYGVCGKQLRGLHVDYALVSMLDVLRDPRWGRSEECYSEDPYLASTLAKEAVLGCQGAGVSVVAKHFCAQGEGTGGVNASAARIGERELREIHLPPMQACCEADVQGVMAAYNEIDGIYCHGNSWLLQKVLREEMGFKGAVMADGTAIDRLDSLTGSSAASAAMALKAGVDISLWDKAFSCLEEAVEQGLVQEEELDRAVLRVLELKFARGLFENPYMPEENPREFSYRDYPESLELARQSVVLLKNENMLPLSLHRKQKIALIGPHGNELYALLGDYTPPLREGEGVSLLQGIQDLLEEETELIAVPGCGICSRDKSGLEAAVQAARESDVVILALGGSSSRFAGARFDINGAALMDGPVEMDCGEGVDCASLKLPGVQDELAQAVLGVKKPTLAVIIAGRPYALPELCEKAQGVLWSFYPGPMGGKALAEILFGKISPSGRLPVSLPRSVGQLPCSYNYKASYQPMKYVDEQNTPLYPFGWGLSYTRFEVKVQFQERISLSALEKGERVEIKVLVKNSGQWDSYAVLQLFIRDVQASTVRRTKELKGFEKVFLQSGEEKTCVLSLGKSELSLWNAQMDFVTEPGEFTLSVEEGGRLLAQNTLKVTEQ